jgi:DNA (cytosine-5)-methyltransferase 1
MTYGSLFGGIRAADYAAAMLDWQIVFNSETDKYCIKLGQQNFGGIELGDITTTDFKPFNGLVDLLCGGFPCQSISCAGGGEGIDGKSSILWRDYVRAIKDVAPKFALIENSPNLLNKGFEHLLFALSEIGYDAEWECFSTAEFGGFHTRNRLWVLAYPNTFRRSGILRLLKGSGHQMHVEPLHQEMGGYNGYTEWFSERYGKPPVWGSYDGLTRRFHVVKRLGAIGNSLYWPIPYNIFKTIEWATKCTETEWLTTNFHALNNQT